MIVMVLTRCLVMSNFKIHKATASDAKAIADIYQDRPITGFSRLTHGTVDPSVFHSGLAEMFAESLGNSDEMLLVARDESHPERRVVSYISLARKTHVVPMTDEQILSARTKYEARLMPGMNGAVLIEMWEKLDRMAERVLAGRGAYWMVDNVGTLSSHQGKGIASALIRAALDACSDHEDGLPMYLDTSGDRDGRAWSLYERLGFVRLAVFEIDLAAHGGEGIHTHFGMLREARRS